MKNIVSCLIILSMILFTFISCENSSSDWVEYEKSKTGNYNFYYKVNIDKKDNNHIVQLWLKNILSNRGQNEIIKIMKGNKSSLKEYDKLSKRMDFVEIDCIKKKWRIKSYYLYNTHDDIISSDEIGSEWMNIIQNDRVDKISREVC